MKKKPKTKKTTVPLLLPEKGGTGWGARWVDALAQFTSTKVLERGLRAAKAGHVLSVLVDQGFAAADVQGSRPRPYKVEIGLPMFTTKQWRRVTDTLLKKAFFTAKLLAGEMPLDIEPLFRDAGAPLLPIAESDLSSDCPCLDMDNPCKHVAAAYFSLGQEIDRNPFLLMEMRGLTRAQLLAEIQARRTSPGLVAKATALSSEIHRPSQTSLSHRLADFFQAPKEAPFGLVKTDGSAQQQSHPAEQIVQAGGRIHEMGVPPFWQSDNDFEDVLTRIYKAVRKHVSQ